MKNKWLLISGVIVFSFLLVFLIINERREKKFTKYAESISVYLRKIEEERIKEITDYYNVACLNDVKVFDVEDNFVSSWVLSQCFYPANNQIVETTGYSMAFKFKLLNDEIMSYENPEDGNEYRSSMEELFSKKVIWQMDRIDSSKMQDKVKKEAQELFGLSDFIYENETDYENKLKLYYELGNQNIYTYNLDNVSVDGKELSDLLNRNDYTIDDFISKLERVASMNDGGTTIYKDGGTKLINGGDISVIKCNTIAGNRDIIIGNKDLEYKSNFCKSNKTTVTRTYTVKDIKEYTEQQYEDGIPVSYGNSWEVTLSQYQGETATVILNNIPNELEKDKPYEFEFIFYEKEYISKDDIATIIKELDLVEIRETNKVGTDQIQDWIMTKNN